MLLALMDGKALTSGELAVHAGIARPTASEHLALLMDGGLVAVEPQGRHRYYRIAQVDVAEAIEALSSLSARTNGRRVRPGPKEPRLRFARICYDHLAGESGVQMCDALMRQNMIAPCPSPVLTPAGAAFLHEFGIDPAGLKSRTRPICRLCLDWSERRHHLGGALGAALFNRLEQLGWLHRRDGRIVEFSPSGLAQFRMRFAPG